MKRVIIYSIAYFPKMGGAEIAVKKITDLIGDGDFEFDLVTLRFDSNDKIFEKIGNCNVYRIGPSFLNLSTNKILFPFFAFLKGRGLNKERNYDIVWSIMANRAGFASYFFKKFHPNIKFLLTLQEGDSVDYPKERMGVFSYFLYPIWRKIFRSADCIQVISDYLSLWARECGATCPIVLVPNGVDLSLFGGKDFAIAEDVRKKLGYKKNDFVIITTSRLVEKNGLKDLISSMQFLPEDVRLFILGEGHLESSLRKLADDLGVSSKVCFFGKVSYEDLPRYLWMADVFVRPSITEGMGNSFIEAMASGLPVVATPVGGILDFLKNDQNGLFCEVNNPKSVADAVMKIYKDPALRVRLVAGGIFTAKNYDWRDIVSKMKATLSNI